MAVGIQIKGRDITFTLGGGALLGVNSKGLTFTNEGGDVTDDQSAGWQEFAADPLLKTVEFTMSGIAKNLELVGAYFNASAIYAVVVTYPEGSTLTFDVFHESISHTGESNGSVTFDANYKSSGPVVWSAGT